MGSITKQGKTSWRLKVYAGRDAETGRDRYVYRTVQARTPVPASEAQSRVSASRRSGSGWSRP